MIKYILIDDELPARQNLKTQLDRFFPDLILIGEANSVKSGVELLSHVNTDLVFLDIDLFDGTGFGILEQLEEINFQIIFVTAYNDYAIRAFRVNAIDYILKPIDPKELVQAVEKVKLNQNKPSVKQLIKGFQEAPTNQRLAIKESTGINYVDVADLVHCKSDNSYTEVHLKNGTRITSTRSLKEYDTILKDFGFLRIHQSHLIRITAVQKIIRENGLFVMLKTGAVLPVARRKKEELFMKMKASEI